MRWQIFKEVLFYLRVCVPLCERSPEGVHVCFKAHIPYLFTAQLLSSCLRKRCPYRHFTGLTKWTFHKDAFANVAVRWWYLKITCSKPANTLTTLFAAISTRITKKQLHLGMSVGLSPESRLSSSPHPLPRYHILYFCLEWSLIISLCIYFKSARDIIYMPLQNYYEACVFNCVYCCRSLHKLTHFYAFAPSFQVRCLVS